MLEFLAGATPAGAVAPTGTISWLIDLYQRDDESPYNRVAPITREGYDKSLAILRQTVGERRIDAVTSKDVRRWFRLWGRADEGGALANPRRASGCVQALRIIVKHGRGLRNAACRGLSEILTETEFPAPVARKRFMTPEQAVAIIAEANKAGSASIALALALQFSCGLRQKDVIGEWVKKPDGKQWIPGLRWGEHISSDWRLAKATSKSRGKEVAEFDPHLLPLVMKEMESVPSTARIGPVIVDEHTGRP